MHINKMRLVLSGLGIKNPGEFASLEDIYNKYKDKKSKHTSNLDNDMEFIEKNGIKVIDYFCEDYPKSLKNIEYPPLVLFVLGELKKMELPLSVVGTRYPSGYGQRVIKYTLPYLVKSGFSIISGMAKGVDALSHKETLKNNGYTIAVLGTGIDEIYPKENRSLYEDIKNKGCIISEFPLHTQPLRQNFPRRNRIIAGLSKATLVIEADIKSGSLITARLTEEQSKPVFAVPGEIFQKRSKGTNKLISDGAYIFRDIDDILSYFYVELKEELSKMQKEKPIELNTDEKQIMDILEADMSIDEISLKSGLDISKLNDILFDLEMKGVVKRNFSDRYEKV